MRYVRRRGRFVFVAILAVVLVGCVSGRGIQEFSLYQAAFDRANTAANGVLDQLAIRERELFLRRHRVGVDVAALTFTPEDARYYADSVDPPGTAAFRRSLATVKAYNDLLYALGTGQTAQALTAKLGELQVSVSKAITEIGVTAGAGAQTAAISGGLSSAFRALESIVRTGLKYRSRAAVRVYLLENYKHVRKILVEIRSGTQDIFPLLADAVLRRSRVTGTSPTAEEIAKIETYRKLLSDWVILIDVTIMALDQVYVSMGASQTIASSIAGLNTIAVDLATTAEAARKHLAELAAL